MRSAGRETKPEGPAGAMTRRAFVAMLGAAAAGSGPAARLVDRVMPASPGRAGSTGPGIPADWLVDAPLEGIYRTDWNYGGSSAVNSTSLVGVLGETAVLVRSIFTDNYDAMSFTGHYGDDALVGKLAFGAAGSEDAFSASAKLGADSLSLSCPPGGSVKSGLALTGSMAGEKFSATLGGPGTKVSGDEVTIFEGNLGEASFAVSLLASAGYALPTSLSAKVMLGRASVTSSIRPAPGPSPFLGSVSGSLSGPRVLMIAGLAWWTGFMDAATEGFGP